MSKLEDRIKLIYNASRLNKAYKDIVEEHKVDKNDLKLILSYEAIYQESYRKNFKSLTQLKDESIRFAKEREITQEGAGPTTEEA